METARQGLRAVRRVCRVGSTALLFGALFAAALAHPAAAQSGPVVRYFAPVNQDGCPFCCEFLCQRTPTPTPEFDGHGRRVYRRPTGQFMLDVEAGPGTSNRQPGAEGVFVSGGVAGITNPSGRPSLMLLSEHNLGNGTPQVDCRTIPLGGVQGHPPLDFNADVTTSLVDMACRFEYVNTASFACTRDRFGNFAFLGSGTTRQYCFQVSALTLFPVGDTILALQMLDTSGNLGPRQEIVIRVEGDPPRASPTPTPTRTPALASVAGRLRYYSADRPVPGATVQVSGTSSQSTSTSGSGGYKFVNMASGDITLDPRKVGGFGPPAAITALDAAWVLQAVAGLRSFDANQRLAGDVTGNGSLSALDATRILQRQVGLLSRFAVADQCNSDWIFVPVPGAAANQRLVQPLVSTGSCRHGAIALEPLVGDPVQQDFLSILFGDCTGNWVPPAAAAFRAKAAPGPYSLRVRVPHYGRGGVLRVPLVVDGPEPYSSVDLTLVYDPGALRATAVRPLLAAEEAMLVSNLTRPGEVRIAIASGMPIATGIPLVAIDFDAAADNGSIEITRADVDDQAAGIDRVDH